MVASIMNAAHIGRETRGDILKGSGGHIGILRPVPNSALRGGSSGGVGEAKLRKLQAYACSMRGVHIMWGF